MVDAQRPFQSGGASRGFRPGGPGGAMGRGGRRGRYIPRRKVCGFCVDHVTSIDYKDISLLRRYLSDRARIEPRRRTGTCAWHQRILATALKRARLLALLPFTPMHVRASRGVIAAPGS